MMKGSTLPREGKSAKRILFFSLSGCNGSFNRLRCFHFCGSHHVISRQDQPRSWLYHGGPNEGSEVPDQWLPRLEMTGRLLDMVLRVRQSLGKMERPMRSVKTYTALAMAICGVVDMLVPPFCELDLAESMLGRCCWRAAEDIRPVSMI